MKILPVIISFALCAASLRAEIVFQGYLTTSERALFVLSVDKGRTSGWLAIGQNFDGFSIVAFDSKTEVLTVEKKGERRALHLVDGKVQPGSASTSQAATKSIVISIGDKEQISVGDDAAMMDALKARLEVAAALSPQPTVTIRPPGDATFDRMRTIFDLCRTSGIKRFNISPRDN